MTASCPGKRPQQPGQHAGPVYRCTNCDMVGCADSKCSNYKFTSSGKCLSCGKYSTRRQI